jgi:hypothetical protein
MATSGRANDLIASFAAGHYNYPSEASAAHSSIGAAAATLRLASVPLGVKPYMFKAGRKTSSPQHARGRALRLERLEPRLPLDASMLRITEFLASNDNGLRDADGDASDWIEIYNSGPDAVDMTGLRLRDRSDTWTFPANVMIPAGGYRIVFASNKDGVRGDGELHTNFALSAGGEYLGLIAADGVTVIDEYAPGFPQQEQDVSYGRAMQPSGSSVTLVATGAQGRAWVPTSSIHDAAWREVGFNDAVFNIVGPTGFGYENNPGDAINYTAEIGQTIPNTTRSLYLRIPFTLSTLAGIDRLTLGMRYDDGFAAYINGEFVAAANAPDGLQWNSIATGLHDDSLAEQFISFDASAAIPKLRVGQNVLAIHALNVNGGSDMLISPLLTAQAATIIEPVKLGFFDLPTPGYGNGLNHLGFVATPAFSVPHGYYTSPQSVALSSTPGATIVFTTDGSTPTISATGVPTNGTLYTGPISVTATTTIRAAAFKLDYKPSFVTAQTYIFLSDVINQSPLGQVPPGWPVSGAVNGQEMNYGIDPAIISLYGAQAVKDSLASLPAISITTDLANLFDPSIGIYVNASRDGRDWERPVSVELIAPDGSEGFATNAGLRIRGGYSRGGWNPKHAFRLYFRGEYGDGELDYPLFGDEGVDQFDVIDLRSDQNYAWATSGDTQHSFVREVFGRDLQRDLDEPYTRSRYYHLYLNGQYFGVFQTQERVEENYSADYLGGQPEDYDVLKHGLNDGVPTQVNEGNDAAWRQLFTLAQNLATNPTANANNYWTLQGLNPDGTRNPALPVLLDVDNLINYMLIIFYTGGYDSGISRFLGDNQANNWYGIYNRTAADQGFQFFIHDNEHSLGADGSPHGSLSIDRTGPFNRGNQSNYDYFNPQYLHQDLLAHPDYRQRVIEKTTQYFLNGGPMTPAASIARMQQRIAEVDPAVIAEAARWGDSKIEPPRNKTTWQNEINWLKNTYFPQRTNIVIGQLRLDGLFVFPPAFNPPGGSVPAGSMLTITASDQGTIYYTTDGMTDPRLDGGAVNPSPEVKTYTGPVVLSGVQTIKARLRTASGAWSVLVEATFVVPQANGDYDGDGAVNGSDFLAWQRQLGAAANPAGSGADGDSNGVVDAGDLAVWREHFGPGAVAASLAQSSALTAADATSLDAAYASLAAYREVAMPQPSVTRHAPSLQAVRREAYADPAPVTLVHRRPLDFSAIVQGAGDVNRRIGASGQGDPGEDLLLGMSNAFSIGKRALERLASSWR